MVARKSVRPEMGCYYYTRGGRAAYVAFAFEDGKVLPPGAGVQNYPSAIGFIYGKVGNYEWFPSGSVRHQDDTLDLVERISMEHAFKFPKRKPRPKSKPATQGLLI